MKVRFLLAILGFYCLMAKMAAQTDMDSALWQVDLEDVVVTAQYEPTHIKNVLHDIQLIPNVRISQQGATNLEQLLSQQSSIRIRQDAVLGSSMSLLGLDGQNVKLMIDGVPIIGRQDGNIDLSQINLYQVEQVEIVEGPLAVHYGTDAIAGVVNLISKKKQAKTFQIGGSVQVEERGENVYTLNLGFRPSDHWQIALSGGYDEFGGFSEDTLRSVLWNPKEQRYLDGNVSWYFDSDQQLRYGVRYFEEEVQNLGEVRRPQFKPYAFDDFYQTIRFDHTLTHSGSLSDLYYLQTTAAYNEFERIKNSYRTDFEEQEAMLLKDQQDTSLFTGVMFRSILASRYAESPLNFQLGVDLRYDNATGQRIQDTLSSKENFSEIGDYALFGTLRYTPFSRLTLEGGVRYSYNTRYKAPIVPSIHLKYELHPDWVVRASYAQGFRSPDLKELFFSFIDINHFIVGNPDLKAERSNNAQFSFSYLKEEDTKKTSFQLKGFYNHIHDKIELFEFVETETGNEPAIDTSTLRFTYFNLTKYVNQGLQASLGLEFDAFRFNTSYSLIGYYNPASEDFASVDRFFYASELSNSLTYMITKHELAFSLFLRTNDKLVRFAPTTDAEGNDVIQQVIQDGFTMLDCSILKHFWKKRLSFTVGCKNIFDVQRVGQTGSIEGVHTSTSGTAIIGTGRNWFARIGLDFGW